MNPLVVPCRARYDKGVSKRRVEITAGPQEGGYLPPWKILFGLSILRQKNLGLVKQLTKK